MKDETRSKVVQGRSAGQPMVRLVLFIVLSHDTLDINYLKRKKFHSALRQCNKNASFFFSITKKLSLLLLLKAEFSRRLRQRWNIIPAADGGTADGVTFSKFHSSLCTVGMQQYLLALFPRDVPPPLCRGSAQVLKRI